MECSNFQPKTFRYDNHLLGDIARMKDRWRFASLKDMWQVEGSGRLPSAMRLGSPSCRSLLPPSPWIRITVTLSLSHRKWNTGFVFREVPYMLPEAAPWGSEHVVKWHHFNRFIFNSGIRRSTSNDSNDSNKNNKKYCCQRLCHGSEKFGMLCTHQIWAHATLIKTHNVRNMHHAAGSSDMTFLDWYMQAYDGITITFLYYWYNMSIMFL